LALGALTWIVAGASAQLMHFCPASAADECLAGPNKESPAGHHWYYRVDRSTKHHCWYLGERGRAYSHVARSTSKRAALFAKLRRENSQAHPADDARAELSQPRVGDTLRADDALLTTSTDRKRLVAARSTQDLPEVTTDQDLQSPIATRWPNSASVLLPPTGLTNVSLAGALGPPNANPPIATDQDPGTSPAAMDKVDQADEQGASAGKRTGSLYSLFWALCGAFVLVALSGATYFITCPPESADRGLLSVSFDVSRLTSWLDTTMSLSARYPYRFARSKRDELV
jgi:hypothetical protein